MFEPISISNTYLFQVDCAEANNAFFKTGGNPAPVFYRGANLQIGTARWVPDGVKVEFTDGPASTCWITLIELEATGRAALKSSRKYLSEDSNAILSAFRVYLQRKIADCKSTADPREASLIRLEKVFENKIPVIIKTVGALRSSKWDGAFQEESMITGSFASYRSDDFDVGAIGGENGLSNDGDLLRGMCKLDAGKNFGLRRCLMILDAVIQQNDHSSATLHSWLSKAPLKCLLKRLGGKHAVLRKFIFPEFPNRGTRLDFEALLAELVDLWQIVDRKIDREYARKLICHYWPIASTIGSSENMTQVFERAHSEIELLRL